MTTPRITHELIAAYAHEAHELRNEALRAAFRKMWRALTGQRPRQAVPTHPAAAACR